MYAGMLVAYLGCRLLPSEEAAAYCSCEQVIISAVWEQSGDFPLQHGLIAKPAPASGPVWFFQPNPSILANPLPIARLIHFQGLLDPKETPGFRGSLLRPPNGIA